MGDVRSHRARRWDVLVLGGALPGLVAAVRLARGGLRILVAEEEAALRIPALLREPFALPGPLRGSVLAACLEALGLGLVERRAFQTLPLSHQVIGPNARIDVGSAASTADEWVAWGLAKPELARELAAGLEEAARAEAQALLRAPLVQAPRRVSRVLRRGPADATGSGQGPPRHLRGLPAAASQLPERLERLFQAEIRAFGSHASSRPGPEVRARLLGAALAGGGCFHREGRGLREIVRERLRALHAEFRTLGTPFELVRVGAHPGIVRRGPGDAWLGRLVLLNAPPARLATALRQWGAPVPGFLSGPEPSHRRLSLHLRARAEVVPEALAPRAVLVDSIDPAEEAETVALSWHPSPRGPGFRDAVARLVVPDRPEEFERRAAGVLARVTALMPFSDDRIRMGPLPALPLWDDDAALADGPAADRWPAPVALRGAGREPIFQVPREPLAGLGVEGDLLLGWRLGDALAEQLG